MEDSLSFSVGSKGVLPTFISHKRKVPSFAPATDFASSFDDGSKSKIRVKMSNNPIMDEPVEISGDDDSDSKGNNNNTPKSKSKSNNNSRRQRKSKSSSNSRNGNSGGNGNGSERRKEVTWSSDVKSGLIVSNMQTSSTFQTPLFILYGEMFPKRDKHSNNYYNQIMDRVVYQYYVRNVSLINSRFLERNFTTDLFREYVDLITESLQLYYYINSIMIYYRDPKNQNRGILHLNRELTADIWNGHHELGRVLSQIPIPKRLLYYIRYMYQNFTIGESFNSPIIRLGYKSYLQNHGLSGLALDSQTYYNLQVRFENISNLASQLVLGMRRNIFKKLHLGELPDSCDLMDIDPQFNTFWHNANTAYYDNGEVKYCRCVDSKDENTYYGVFRDEIDGTIYAASSLIENLPKDKYTLDPMGQNSGTGEENPRFINHTGIWKPFDEYTDSWDIQHNQSLCCYENGAIKAVEERNYRISSHLHSGVFRTIPNQSRWEAYSTGYADATIAQYHSVLNLQQAVDNTVLELFC